MKLKAKKAQSVLEYTIILAAIIAAVVAGAALFRQNVVTSTTTAGTMLENSVQTLSDNVTAQ